MSEIKFAQTQTLPVTIVASSSSGHLLGVKEPQAKTKPKNPFTQGFLKQLMKRTKSGIVSNTFSPNTKFKVEEHDE